MPKLLTAEDFRQIARAGRTIGAGQAVQRLAVTDAEEVEGEARTLRFCFSDASVDRAGDTIAQDGWELGNFKKNPVALWAHDSCSPPIGRATEVGVVGERLMGNIEFAPLATYAFADTVYRLTQAGYIKAVSVGFVPIDYKIVQTPDRGFGIDFVRQELCEISLCPVPMNANALQEARKAGIDTRPLAEWAERLLDGGGQVMVPRALLEETFKAAKTPRAVRQKYLLPKADTPDWKCGAARDLQIDEESAWDGGEAEASIFSHAGGDDFDPAVAKKGFLAYDAAKPKLRGSYKLPFAKVVGGKLTAVKAGIHAAASRLPNTDISEGAKKSAQAVIDHYEEKMKKPRALTNRGEDEGTDGMGGNIAPVGNCGRDAEEECGMKDPTECAIHAPKPAPNKALVLRAGAHMSRLNKARLKKAMKLMDEAAAHVERAHANADQQTGDPDPEQEDVAEDTSRETDEDGDEQEAETGKPDNTQDGQGIDQKPYEFMSADAARKRAAGFLKQTRDKIGQDLTN